MLADSIVFEKRDMITTPVPMINVALSGSIDGGMLPGVLEIAGPSKHFKTLFGLLLVSSFLQKHPDGIVIFYDSEFGTPEHYFKTFGIDPACIVHCPVTTVEDLSTDLVNQVNNIKKGDPVMILLDSIGNLASMKEVEDTEKGKNVADMTRAKKLKALFRINQAKLNLKGVPLVAINHTYKTLEMYSKDVVGGGTGPIYGANDIWIVGRQQDKDSDKELQGWNFIINIEKSRTVKEKSKIPVTVSFEQGIQRWSGLLDLAIEAGIIDNSTQGWYAWDEPGACEMSSRRNEIEYNGEFWKNILEKTNLIQYIEQKYRLPDNIMVEEKEDDPT